MLKRFHIFDAGILSQSCHSMVTKSAVAGILKTKELYNPELARLCDTDRCSFVRLLCPHRRSSFYVPPFLTIILALLRPDFKTNNFRTAGSLIIMCASTWQKSI